MEVLLLGIYCFFVWLIFIKLKWLPWNIGTQVTVVIIPIVGLAVLILALNVVAPSSADVRVYKYTVPIVSQVRGRVIGLFAMAALSARAFSGATIGMGGAVIDIHWSLAPSAAALLILAACLFLFTKNHAPTAPL